jgi:uncharacterized protein with NRDE domain
MCTIIVLNDAVPGYPLIVASNRDERIDRVSSPPKIQNVSTTRVISPRDFHMGGTWMGAAEKGWVVGVTNQHGGDHRERATSRGLVVSECLEAPSHASAARLLMTIPVGLYNPFNLVFGKPGAMFVSTVMSGHPLEMTPILGHVTAISNDCVGHEYDSKVMRAEVLTLHMLDRHSPRRIEDVREGLFRTLADHNDGDSFQSLCVHADERTFETRSTSIITVSNQGNVEYWYSEGAPCKSAGLILVGTL